jgi:RNA polymerase-binding transcription factor DksA
MAKTSKKAKATKKPAARAKKAAKKSTAKKTKGATRTATTKATAKSARKKPTAEAKSKVSAPAKPMAAFPNTPVQRPIAYPAKNISVPQEKTRYSEEELKEFEKLILEKLEKARAEYRILKETLNRNNDEGTDATAGGNTKVLEDGAETAEKENLSQLAARQQKYITNLENALVRIKNGTYGICSVTGKLIPKERLLAVPHTTQSIEAKMMQTD